MAHKLWNHLYQNMLPRKISHEHGWPSPNGRWLGESHINNPIIISPNDSPFGGFPKLEVPHYGCFIMENPFKVDDLGAPPILEKPTPAVSPCDAEKKRAAGLPNHTVELRPHWNNTLGSRLKDVIRWIYTLIIFDHWLQLIYDLPYYIHEVVGVNIPR